METKALGKEVEFLTDCGYVAALSREVPADGMFHRRILDTSVPIYRKADGAPVALHDRCPHRFAPLHLGKRIGDDVLCAYHALRFDCSGACTHNPHGTGLIPKAAKVRSSPLLEKYGFVWIWMGEAALADPAKLPHFGPLERGHG
jgi:vanillate O-demethylase monooxygenase subunit